MNYIWGLEMVSLLFFIFFFIFGVMKLFHAPVNNKDAGNLILSFVGMFIGYVLMVVAATSATDIPCPH